MNKTEYFIYSNPKSCALYSGCEKKTFKGIYLPIPSSTYNGKVFAFTLSLKWKHYKTCVQKIIKYVSKNDKWN